MDKVFHSESNVFTNLPKQDRGNIPARVEWNRCAASIGMPKLLVRTALTNFLKTKLYQDRNNFLRFENWKFVHLMPP